MLWNFNHTPGVGGIGCDPTPAGSAGCEMGSSLTRGSLSQRGHIPNMKIVDNLLLVVLDCTFTMY